MIYEKTSERPLTADEGQLLLNLARLTIAAELGIDCEKPSDLDRPLKIPVFAIKRGTFVTIKKAGDLRGCIGSLAANQPLAENIRTNALNAAFRDPRFPPLTTDEWNQIQIEISVLTEPQKLDFSAGKELPERLNPHVDGVILRKGYVSATFLPQVWKQLSRPEDFLAHLCLKAGWPADAWRRDRLEVETYQVQYFEE